MRCFQPACVFMFSSWSVEFDDPYVLGTFHAVMLRVRVRVFMTVYVRARVALLHALVCVCLSTFLLHPWPWASCPTGLADRPRSFHFPRWCRHHTLYWQLPIPIYYYGTNLCFTQYSNLIKMLGFLDTVYPLLLSRPKWRMQNEEFTSEQNAFL
jgi:hypothetical protein